MIGTRTINVDENSVNQIDMKSAIKKNMKNIRLNIAYAEDENIAVAKCTNPVGERYYLDVDAQDKQLQSVFKRYGHLKKKFIRIPLKADQDPSAKMNNKFLQYAYDAEIDRKGAFNTYHLVTTDAGMKLVSNIDKSELIPDNISYTYVITRDNENRFELKIRNGGHYYTADKAAYVYAAGDITFRNQKIVSIDNRSGSYHLNKEDLYHLNISADKFIDSVTSVMKEVNLPTDKFVLFDKQVKTPTPISNNKNIFFTQNKILVFGIGSLILAGGFVMQNM